jgi:hypothetical protein
MLNHAFRIYHHGDYAPSVGYKFWFCSAFRAEFFRDEMVFKKMAKVTGNKTTANT